MFQPKVRPKPKGKKVAYWTLYGAWTLLLLGLGAFFGYGKGHELIGHLINNFFKPKPPEELFQSPDLTILVLGTDEDRAPGGKKVDREAARSDMIMALRLNFPEKRVTGITIPRDTLARVEGYAVHRVNAFHAFGGADLSRRAVENITGLKFDKVMVINYRVFKEIVDMVDGVEIDVKKKLKYDDDRGHLHIDLSPGLQHMDGDKAMGFVRYRKDSDFERQARQRQFVMALKSQAMQKWTMIGPVSDKIGELTGEAFTNEELASLLFFAKSVEDANIKLGMLPIIEGSNFNLMVDKVKLQKTLKEYELISS